jgi:hypothetical protein
MTQHDIFGPPMGDEEFQKKLAEWLTHSESEKQLHVAVPVWALKRALWDWRVDREEVARLNGVINTPEIIDFVKAVQIEAVHQRERWGSEHDEGKTPADWFWLLGYLAGKALHSAITGDRDKLLHHIITTAAACANWHAQVLGKCDMRPGIATPAADL